MAGMKNSSDCSNGERPKTQRKLRMKPIFKWNSASIHGDGKNRADYVNNKILVKWL